MLAQVRCYRQKQRAGARHDHSFACNRQAGFHHGLQPAGAHDIGKRPAGKRKEAFPGAGGQYQFLVLQFESAIRPFRQQRFWLRLMKHPGPAQHACTGSLQPGSPIDGLGCECSRFRLARSVLRVRNCRRRSHLGPHSAAHTAAAMPAGPPPITSTSKCVSASNPDSLGPDFHARLANHLAKRQCGCPLTTTRHSKQIPIPHNGPRVSPLTDIRQACTGPHNRDGDRCAGRHSNRRPVDGDSDRLRHEHAPPGPERANTGSTGMAGLLPAI